MKYTWNIGGKRIPLEQLTPKQKEIALNILNRKRPRIAEKIAEIGKKRMQLDQKSIKLRLELLKIERDKLNLLKDIDRHQRTFDILSEMAQILQDSLNKEQFIQEEDESEVGMIFLNNENE